MTSPLANSKRATRALVRGVNWLGDAIMSTPALLRLREAHPDWHITLLTRESLADLWPNHPAVDNVIVFQKDESVWSVARRLRAGCFQIGISLPNSTRSALELCLARIPQRVGFGGRARQWLLTDVVARPGNTISMRKRSKREILELVRNCGAGCQPAGEPGILPGGSTERQDAALTGRLEACSTVLGSTGGVQRSTFPNSAHHIHHYLELVRYLGATAEPLAPHIAISSDEVKNFLARWQLTPSPAAPLFGLAPGAEYGPAKRWPEERFIAAAAEIQARTCCQWIIFGGPGEVAVAQKISAGIDTASKGASANSPAAPPRVMNLAGATSLRDLCSGLKACRVVLTNDTGPMHLAAAVGTSVVAIFGSTSPELTGPGLPGASDHVLLQSKVPCSPCFLRTCPIDFRCMESITPKQVVDAVLTTVKRSQ